MRALHMIILCFVALFMGAQLVHAGYSGTPWMQTVQLDDGNRATRTFYRKHKFKEFLEQRRQKRIVKANRAARRLARKEANHLVTKDNRKNCEDTLCKIFGEETLVGKVCRRTCEWEFGDNTKLNDMCRKFCIRPYARYKGEGEKFTFEHSDDVDKNYNGFNKRHYEEMATNRDYNVKKNCEAHCSTFKRCNAEAEEVYLNNLESRDKDWTYASYKVKMSSCKKAQIDKRLNNGCHPHKCLGFTWLIDYTKEVLDNEGFLAHEDLNLPQNGKTQRATRRRQDTEAKADDEPAPPANLSSTDVPELDPRSPLYECITRNGYKEFDMCISECEYAHEFFMYDNSLTCEVLGNKGKGELLAIFEEVTGLDMSDVTDEEYDKFIAGPGGRCCTGQIEAIETVNIGWGSSEHTLGPYEGCMERTGNWTEYCNAHCYYPENLFQHDGTGNLTCKALGDSSKDDIVSLIGNMWQVNISGDDVPDDAYEKYVSIPGEKCCATTTQKILNTGRGWKETQPFSLGGRFGTAASVTASLFATVAPAAMAAMWR